MNAIRLPVLPAGPHAGKYPTNVQTHLWFDPQRVCAIAPADSALNGFSEPACFVYISGQAVAMRVVLPADEVAALLGWTHH